MAQWVQSIITVICAVVASSGFWTWWMKKSDKKSIHTQLLLGLAHDRIMQSGMYYIERGYITNDEYENLYDYLYKPYKEMGGNGSAERVMREVGKLDIRKGKFSNEVLARHELDVVVQEGAFRI